MKHSSDSLDKGSENQSVEERWLATWDRIGVEAPPAVLAELQRRHAEKHRHYHDMTHVLDCLGKAEGCRDLQEQAELVDLALWFHDAVYAPRRGDNEEKSADLARASLAASLETEQVEVVSALILDTVHQAPPATSDGEVLVDIDLSILGEPETRFDAYERAIRKEYSWVPWFLYRRKRVEILRSFLDRERIFTTATFHDRYESGARDNLQRSIDKLSS